MGRVVRHSSVGIATRYGLGGTGVESRWKRDFPHPSRRLGAHPDSYTMGTGSFPGVKRPGRGVNHPPPSSAEVKVRVELYLYFSSGSSWSLPGQTLSYFLLWGEQLCSWLRHRFTRREVSLAISSGILGNIFLSALSSPGVYSASNRHDYQGIVSLQVKCGRHVELTALPF